MAAPLEGGAGIFGTEVSLLALSRDLLVSQLIETAAHQLAPLGMASCAPQVPVVSSCCHLQGRGRCRALTNERGRDGQGDRQLQLSPTAPSFSTPNSGCWSFPIAPPASSQWPVR